MIQNYVKQVTVSAVSAVEESGSNRAVVFMSATVPEDGNYNISKVVKNRDLYFKYKESIDLDVAEFESHVNEIVQEMEQAREE